MTAAGPPDERSEGRELPPPQEGPSEGGPAKTEVATVRAHPEGGAHPGANDLTLAGPQAWQRTLAYHPGGAEEPPRPRSLGTLGDYELLAELGRGGMGIVYKARQRGLNRLVALKTVLAEGPASASEVQRFRNEAEAAANLRHPGIVAIHEVGEVAGRHYYSMELIEGDDLSQLVREHSLAADLAAQYLVQLSDAVQYAHEHGVLHRDLKPSNVLRDDNGCVKITDFGLAKRVNGDSQLTGAGIILGTPSYMPPEQASPARGPVGPHSDVYSLGAILYELLTCRPPFRAENPLETIRQVLHDEPIAPRLLNPHIPRDLETICLKCLDKDPARRYGSARLLADELRRFLAGEPILARPIRRSQRIARWCRRHPVDASLIAAVAAAVLLGLLGVGWQWRRAERHLARAERNFELLNTASDEMLQVVEEWVTRAPPQAGSQQERLHSTLELFELFLEEEPTNTTAKEKLAETHRRVADIRRSLRQLDLAAQQYRLAIQHYERLASESGANDRWRRRIADAWDSLGYTLQLAEKFDDARQAFDTALAIQEQLSAERPGPEIQEELARTLYNRGVLRLNTGARDESRADHDRAVQLLEAARRSQPDGPALRQGLARCCINLGILSRDRRELTLALEYYDRAVGLLQELRKERPSQEEYAVELAQAQMNRGNMLLVAGSEAPVSVGEPLAAAQASFESATALLEGLAREFPNVPEYRIQLANSLNGLGAVHQRAKRGDAARPALERARDQFLAVLQGVGESADVRHRLGLTLANLALLAPPDQPRERVSLLQEALDQQRHALQLNPSSTVYPAYLRSHRLSLGRSLLQLGEHRDAAEQAEELVRMNLQPAEDWRHAAELLARAVEVCGEDERLDANERRRAAADYAGRAVAILRRAVESGWAERQQLRRAEPLAPLRGQADFEALTGD